MKSDNTDMLANLANHLESEGFSPEASGVNNVMKRLAQFSFTDLATEELQPPTIKYQSSGAVDDVTKILEEGAYMLNAYRQMENYVDMSSGHLLERADYLVRQYTDTLTDMDKQAMGQMERDIHRIQKKINSQSAIPETSIR